MIQENFIKLYEHSFRENWDLPCYTNYGENESYTYGEVAQEIARLHLIFKYCQLRRGDKIAVIGKNNARWCIAYMATITALRGRPVRRRLSVRRVPGGPVVWPVPDSAA